MACFSLTQKGILIKAGVSEKKSFTGSHFCFEFENACLQDSNIKFMPNLTLLA